MNRIILIVACTLIISGCVSQVMKQYVGKDIREVYMEHGKPINEFDMADGRRAPDRATRSPETRRLRPVYSQVRT